MPHLSGRPHGWVSPDFQPRAWPCFPGDLVSYFAPDETHSSAVSGLGDNSALVPKPAPDVSPLFHLDTGHCSFLPHPPETRVAAPTSHCDGSRFDAERHRALHRLTGRESSANRRSGPYVWRSRRLWSERSVFPRCACSCACACECGEVCTLARVSMRVCPHSALSLEEQVSEP